MKKTKMILAFLLASIMVFSVGCGPTYIVEEDDDDRYEDVYDNDMYERDDD